MAPQRRYELDDALRARIVQLYCDQRLPIAVLERRLDIGEGAIRRVLREAGVEAAQRRPAYYGEMP